MKILEPGRRFVRAQILHTTTPREEEALFVAYAEATTGRVVLLMAIAFIAASLLWSVGDSTLLGDDPEARAAGQLWRIGNVVVLLPVILLARFSGRMKRHPVGVAAAFMALACGWATWNVGQIPPDAAWFGMLYATPMVSIMLFVPFVPRVVFTSVFAVVAWIGYFGLHPQRLAEEQTLGLVISQQSITVFASVGLGHLVYHQLREAFRARKALAEANEVLETRVRAQRADLRRMADRIETVREAERVELARELHDELGQVLTALRFEFVLLESSAQRQGSAIDLKDIDFYLDRMGRSFRSILQRLRPRILDDFGLVAAAEWLVTDLGAQSSLPISFSVSPVNLKVPGEHRIIAFRALRESLVNAARHASARSVTVVLHAEGETLTVTVSDDGLGIGPRSEWPEEAIGIIGTRERARTVGGDFVVQRQDGGGTLAVLRIPLPLPSSANNEAA